MGKGVAQVGNLDRRVTIQEQTTVVQPSGQHKNTGWSDLADVWAAIMIKGGGEKYEDSQRVANLSTTFQIRKRSDVTVEMRVVHDSKNYYIHQIIEVGRDKRLNLLCVQRDNV